jgi:hypothetical protein
LCAGHVRQLERESPFDTPENDSSEILTQGLTFDDDNYPLPFAAASSSAIVHHVTIDPLRDSYQSLKKQAAPGVDGLSWKNMGANWRSGYETSTGVSIAVRIRRDRHAGSISRKPMEGNDHWASRRWKTKSYSTR